MLLYYTQVQVKETFTSKQLIDMFIHWMQNTKNKMKHFDYDDSFQYVLENDHKRFEIKNGSLNFDGVCQNKTPQSNGEQ